jgi:hypothetical protein
MDTVQRVCRFNNILVCFANHVHILHNITFLCLLCTDRDDEPTSALTYLQFIKGSWILLIIELYFPSRIFLYLAVINSQAHCRAHVHTTPFKIRRNEKVVTLEKICIRVQQYTSSWLSLFTLKSTSIRKLGHANFILTCIRCQNLCGVWNRMAYIVPTICAQE